MNIKLVPFSLFTCSFFLAPNPFFLIPFPFFFFHYWGDQCLSLDIGFDTIVLLIAKIMQSDRMHISAKIV